MLTAEIKKMVKRKEYIALMAFILFPLIQTIATRLATGTFIWQGDPLGAIEYMLMVFVFQDEILIPSILMAFIVCQSFHSEIHNRQIYLYKDIPRYKILNVKYLTLYLMYFIYIIGFAVSAFVMYWLSFKNDPIATGTFCYSLSNALGLLYYDFEVFLSLLFTVHVAIFFSLRFQTGFSVAITAIIYLAFSFLPESSNIRLFLPAYGDSLINQNYILSVVLSIVVWIVWNTGLYFMNRKKIASADFS